MKALPVFFRVLLAVLTIAGIASAADYGSIGYSDDTIIRDGRTDRCYGDLIYNHDYSFENGYCWQLGGIVPPYYGAFAEGFDPGGGIAIECAVFWLTQIGYFSGQPLDIYVWDGGVTGPPSAVHCVDPGQTGLEIGFWPTCSMNELWTTCCVFQEFSIGYWADFSGGICGWYCCADENGFGGFPWTCVAPGIGYPTGWQHPSVIWGSSTMSLGIGAVIQGFSSPPESRTWGAIKAMFD